MKKEALKRRKGKGERKKKGWQREKDNHFWTKKKEWREVKRRKKVAEEILLEEKFAIVENGDVTATKLSIFKRMEYVLSTVKSAQTYGPKTKKDAAFSACVGYTSNTIGLNGFKTPHNLTERRHLGIHIFHPENRRSPWWLMEMWHLSKKLIPLYDQSFGNGD